MVDLRWLDIVAHVAPVGGFFHELFRLHPCQVARLAEFLHPQYFLGHIVIHAITYTYICIYIYIYIYKEFMEQ